MDTFWRYAIHKEMENIRISFEILDRYHHVSVGRKKVTGRMVFDVNIDFMRKARGLLDEHRNPDPHGSLYDVVVSRESIRITLMYAELNGLKMGSSTRCPLFSHSLVHIKNNSYFVRTQHLLDQKLMKIFF